MQFPTTENTIPSIPAAPLHTPALPPPASPMPSQIHSLAGCGGGARWAGKVGGCCVGVTGSLLAKGWCITTVGLAVGGVGGADGALEGLGLVSLGTGSGAFGSKIKGLSGFRGLGGSLCGFSVGRRVRGRGCGFGSVGAVGFLGLGVCWSEGRGEGCFE